MNCPDCSFENSAIARYCSGCGKSLGGKNPAGGKVDLDKESSINREESISHKKTSPLEAIKTTVARIKSERLEQESLDNLLEPQDLSPNTLQSSSIVDTTSNNNSASMPFKKASEVKTIMTAVELMKYELEQRILLRKKSIGRDYLIPLFDRLISTLPDSPREVDILLPSSPKNNQKILELIDLLERKLTKPTPVNQKTKIKSSNLTEIDQSELLAVVNQLSKRIAEDESSIKKTKFKTDEDEEKILPSPSSFSLLRALTIDGFISLIITAIISWPREIPLDGYSSISKASEYYRDLFWLPSLIFISSYLALIVITSIIFGTTPGAKAEGIRICDIHGYRVSRLRVGLRILGHILTFATLGLRIVYWIVKDNGYYCPISKTRLSYEAFLKKTSSS